MNALKSAIAASVLAATAGSAHAQVFEDVTFDCTGSLTNIVETAEGVRAVGLVSLTVDLPNGAAWDSAGVVVIELPESAAGRKLNNLKLRRCLGRGRVDAQLSGTVNGVDIYRLRVSPSEIRVRAGNQRISDPTRVGFGTTASGSPNV